ncbi:MAG: aquaporin [Phycisphaeraceae bacterium]
MNKAIQCYICEFVGTFALCFVGIAAIKHLGNVPGGLVGIALAHGLTIAVMVSATGAISGGHLNPAVTIGLLLARKIDVGNAVGYLISQCLAGVAAAALLIPSLGREAIGGGTPVLAADVTIGSGILIEAVLTFFLVFVIYGSAVDKRGATMGGLFIGLTVTLDILAGGPITGAAMNPARHLGPALVSGDGALIGQIWLYWVGPVIGGVIAALLWCMVLEQKN